MNDLLLSMEVDSHIKKHAEWGHFAMIYQHSLLLNTNTVIWTYRKAMRIYCRAQLFSKDVLAAEESFRFLRKETACYQYKELSRHCKFWDRIYHWIWRKFLIRDLVGQDCFWLLCIDDSCFWDSAVALTSVIITVELAGLASPTGNSFIISGCRILLRTTRRSPHRV